jgi:hypothetical protein
LRTGSGATERVGVIFDLDERRRHKGLAVFKRPGPGLVEDPKLAPSLKGVLGRLRNRS